MTEKRFKKIQSKFTGKYFIKDNDNYYNFCGFQDEWNCIRFVNALNELYEENKELKEENQELHRLNHEEVESWSDEKKQMIADFSNLMFGDKINDRKQKNNWKNEY